MNYEQIYSDLIEKRKANPASGYTERHHILPESMGGTNDPENLVRLTGREHWVAHLLLHKIHGISKTAHACHMMAMRCEERGIPQIRNSRMYQSIREQLIPVWSENGKRRLGPKNGAYGTRWICNIETEQNSKIDRNDPIPDGWIAGRNKWKTPKKKVRGSGLTNREAMIKRYDRHREEIAPYLDKLREEYKTFNGSLNQFITKAVDRDGILKKRTLYNYLKEQ